GAVRSVVAPGQWAEAGPPRLPSSAVRPRSRSRRNRSPSRADRNAGEGIPAVRARAAAQASRGDVGMIDGAEGNVGPGARMRGCPPPEQLAALAGDALPENLRHDIAAHLATCQACQALADDLARLDEVEPPASLEPLVLSAPAGQGRWALLV